MKKGEKRTYILQKDKTRLCAIYVWYNIMCDKMMEEKTAKTLLRSTVLLVQSLVLIIFSNADF